WNVLTPANLPNLTFRDSPNEPQKMKQHAFDIPYISINQSQLFSGLISDITFHKSAISETNPPCSSPAYFKSNSGLSTLKCLICPCSTRGVGNSSLSILILILLLSGNVQGIIFCTSPLCGLAM